MVRSFKTEARIKGIGRIKFKVAPWDEALETIRLENGEVISAPILAYAKVQTGKDSSISQHTSRIREGGIYVPQKGIYLLRNSLLLQPELAKGALIAHEAQKEYSIEDSLAKEYMAKASEDKNSEVFPLTNLDSISTNTFDKDKRVLWLFQDYSEIFGRFLYDNGIQEMPLQFFRQNRIDKEGRPFTNQLDFKGLEFGDKCAISGVYHFPPYYDDVRAVFKEKSK